MKPAEPIAIAAQVVTPPASGKTSQALVPAAQPGAPRPAKSEAKWEMVIPKMARPLTTRLPRVLQPAAAPPAAAAETPTEISFYAGSEPSFVSGRWKVVIISTAVVAVACVIAWVRPGGESGSGSETAADAAGSWSRRTAYVIGARDPREILIYSGSQDVKNYHVEFSWVPDTHGVGLIYRATDSANYYASKLRLIQGGATSTMSAEHFTVVKGVEGAHSRKVVNLGRANKEILVRMDANGPSFTLYLQGSPADYWTDGQFESGSLGFYEERGERPVLNALRFTLFRKGGLQTVQTSLQ